MKTPLRSRTPKTYAALSLAAILLAPFALAGHGIAQQGGAPAKETSAAPTAVEGQIDELERRIQILTEEIRRIRETQAIPEGEEFVEEELESVYGFAPAASKIYRKERRGLSLGGYGEFNLKKEVSDKQGNDDVFDFLRFVGYVGYKFTDRILLNTEIEFEHGSTSNNGSVSVEFGYLDFLLTPAANIRAGLLLVPVGFINEMHEPPFFHGNDRPAVERQIIPTTWRANGAGFFGEILPGLEYRTYAVTSLRASEFTSANLRDGRQNGSEEKAEDFSWVGRLDYEPWSGLDFSSSVYLGNQGQDDQIVLERDPVTGDPIRTGTASAFMQMYEAHAQWRWRGIEARALGVWVELDDAASLSVNAGEPHDRLVRRAGLRCHAAPMGSDRAVSRALGPVLSLQHPGRGGPGL
jgi:hypothetical protein